MPLRNCLNIYEILAPSRPSRTNSPTNSSQQSSKYLFKTKMSRAHKLVTSHAKTYTNGFPFSNGNPFTSRFSSVQLKFASVRTAWVNCSKRKSVRSNGCVIRSQKLPNRSNGWCTRSQKFASVRAVWSSVHKNQPSVRTACAIRSEKLSIRSNACGIRSEKFASVRTTWSSVQKNYPSV